MAILEAERLTKQFRNFIAVDDISFHLGEGEILGLLGPNGAGKTTTIQMLLGILTPTYGEIRYFGEDLNAHREEILEQVNFSSTYVNLPWNFSVRESLRVTSYFYNISNRRERLAEIKEKFDLEEVWDKRLGDLSSGQLTRVNLAKGFLNQPRVLLLDEPTASLDPEVAKRMREFLLAEQERRKISIIITSHNMAEVEEMCDRVIFLNQGRIIADDKPENLARSIRMARVELLLRAGLGKLKAYVKSEGWEIKNEGKLLKIRMPEEKVGRFLHDVSGLGVRYDSVSISKASLEDYFLEVVGENLTEEET